QRPELPLPRGRAAFVGAGGRWRRRCRAVTRRTRRVHQAERHAGSVVAEVGCAQDERASGVECKAGSRGEEADQPGVDEGKILKRLRITTARASAMPMPIVCVYYDRLAEYASFDPKRRARTGQ